MQTSHESPASIGGGLFNDRSSLEIFINDGEAVLSTRLYPKENSREIVFIPTQGALHLNQVTFYDLK